MYTSLFTALAALATFVSAYPILSPRQQPTCVSGAYILHARGSTETEAEDATLPVVAEIMAAVPNSAEQDIEYPAVIISDDSFYSSSVRDGIDDLIAKIEAYVEACGEGSQIVLLGYSQGGNVISSALAGGLVHPVPLGMSYRKYIKAAAVFADPTHRADQSYNAGNATGSGIFKRVWPSLPLLNRYADVYKDYCGEDDFFCDAGGNLDVHYAAVDTYGPDAAQFVISKFQ